jgi:hypothetical protein
MNYMKVLLGMTLAVVIAGSAVTANVGFAQAEDPPTFPVNQAFMSQRSLRWMSARADGWMEDELGEVMHEAMIAAFADALGLDAADLEVMLKSGELMMDIALANGLTSADVWEIMQVVREDARAAVLDSGIVLPAWRESMANTVPFDCTEDSEMNAGSARRGGRSGSSLSETRFSNR